LHSDSIPHVKTKAKIQTVRSLPGEATSNRTVYCFHVTGYSALWQNWSHIKYLEDICNSGLH